MKAKIYVLPKPSVLDPQGQAIVQALHNMRFNGIEDVRQGKYFEIQLAEKDSAQAKKVLTEMCDRLLANTIIETYRIDISE